MADFQKVIATNTLFRRYAPISTKFGNGYPAGLKILKKCDIEPQLLAWQGFSNALHTYRQDLAKNKAGDAGAAKQLPALRKDCLKTGQAVLQALPTLEKNLKQLAVELPAAARLPSVTTAQKQLIIDLLTFTKEVMAELFKAVPANEWKNFNVIEGMLTQVEASI